MFEQYLNLTHYDIYFFLKAIGVTLCITMLSISIGKMIEILMGLILVRKQVFQLSTNYIEP